MTRPFISMLLAGTGVLWATAPAHAQGETAPAEAAVAQPAAPAAEAPAAAATAPSDIVVTGTRIVRDGYTAPTPVTVARTEDLIKTTPSSIPDALNKLPQFQNSLSPARAASNFSNFPIHGNILNLRGLGTPSNNPKGPLRTLILFDGIRVPPTEYVGTIDTNVLPEMLMQRVDVVTGGASAQWGSDAVAGVVNFVLDKKFTGIKGVVQGGVAERGYNANQRIGLAGGWDFADGKGHVLLSGDYLHNAGMLRSDRAIGRQSYVYVGSVTTNCGPSANGQQRSCTVAPGSAANPYALLNDIRISALAPNGRIVGSSVTGNPFVGMVINPNGTTRPFNLGTAVGTTGFQQGGDGYTIPSHTHSVIPSKSYQSFARVSYDVTPDITAYAQGIFARSDLKYITQANALVPASESVSIFKGNPFLPAAIDATLPTANDFITIGQYDAGQPQPVARERTDFWMATAGLQGTLSSFNWTVNYTHGESKHRTAASGLYENKKLYAAADAVLVNGVPTCRVLTNPDPAIQAQYTGCTPVDFLHGNPAASTPAGYDYVTGTSSYRARIKQDSVTANISGSLFELPAGPVDFAVGAEYRRQSLRLTSNADPANLPVGTTPEIAAARAAFFAGLRGVPATALYYWLTNVGGAHGNLNVKEAYGEIAIPIFKDAPFLQELSVNGAARITDYSTSGTVKTWKVGATWKPVQDLLLRGTYSRDIRAPNLFELFAGPQSGIGIVNDVTLKDAAGNVIYGSGQNVNVNSVTIGNSGLKPEKAKTLTIGGVFQPSFLPGFSISVDYYRIKVTALIEVLTAQQILTNCLNAGGSGAPECSQIARATPTTFPSLVTVIPRNIAFLKTSGIDIDASYRAALGNGALSVRLYANYLDKFDAQQFPGAPIAHYAGVSVVTSNPAGYPRWRGNLTVDYSNGPFGLTVSEQYIGKMRLDIPGGPVPIAFLDSHVKPVWYTDLAFRFNVPGSGGNMEFFTTINNLFDKDPPLIPGTVPGVNLPTNIAIYDFIGRAYTAGVRFKF